MNAFQSNTLLWTIIFSTAQTITDLIKLLIKYFSQTEKKKQIKASTYRWTRRRKFFRRWSWLAGRRRWPWTWRWFRSGWRSEIRRTAEPSRPSASGSWWSLGSGPEEIWCRCCRPQDEDSEPEKSNTCVNRLQLIDPSIFFILTKLR